MENMNYNQCFNVKEMWNVCHENSERQNVTRISNEKFSIFQSTSAALCVWFTSHYGYTYIHTVMRLGPRRERASFLFPQVRGQQEAVCWPSDLSSLRENGHCRACKAAAQAGGHLCRRAVPLLAQPERGPTLCPSCLLF